MQLKRLVVGSAPAGSTKPIFLKSKFQAGPLKKKTFFDSFLPSLKNYPLESEIFFQIPCMFGYDQIFIQKIMALEKVKCFKFFDCFSNFSQKLPSQI